MATTPEILPSARSNGVATVVAMLSGLAPGRLALTVITGKSTSGSGATGSKRQLNSPQASSAKASRQLAIGRLTNRLAGFISPAPPRLPLAHGGESADQRTDRQPVW